MSAGMPPSTPSGQIQSQRVAAGVLGILLGGLGLHRFIIGDVTGGILRIVISVFTCGIGSIIGLVEGIIYLTRTDEQFVAEYQVGKKAWF
jgi:TM2 domain-containing membrane protein YozV